MFSRGILAFFSLGRRHPECRLLRPSIRIRVDEAFKIFAGSEKPNSGICGMGKQAARPKKTFPGHWAKVRPESPGPFRGFERLSMIIAGVEAFSFFRAKAPRTFFGLPLRTPAHAIPTQNQTPHRPRPSWRPWKHHLIKYVC